MTLLSSKKGKLIGITGIIIILLLFSGLYFLYIQPLKTTLANKQRELQTEEQLLSVIENQINNTGSDAFESTEALQKEIPVQPLVEQLLLDIEKAEIVSGSLVSNMDFSDSDIEEESEEETLADPLDDTQKVDEEEISEQADEKTSIPMPAGMKKTTVILTVQSADYFSMEKFIQSIETENRIILVENLQIYGQDEIISTDQEKPLIESEITISAFYMPTLTDLIDQLPKMEVPNTSNKKNPFSMSFNISQQANKMAEKQVENSSDANEQSNNTISQTEIGNDIVKYTVQPGDSLSRIASSFFESEEGIQIIKDWNKLDSTTIKTGQVIEIPLN